MTTYTTSFSDDYLTEWLRLARLADDLRALVDGQCGAAAAVDVLLAFEEDADTLVAERLVDAGLVGLLAEPAHVCGVGLPTVTDVLVHLEAREVARAVLAAGVPLPLPVSWLIELAADHRIDADLVPQPELADTDADDWVAWHVALAVRGWDCFLASAAALEERGVRLDEWDAPRYSPRRGLVRMPGSL